MRLYPHSESGNVLFLILIAVALFAALSYAVTSSSRTGDSRSTTSEVALIDSSEIVQFGSALENAITYLRVSKRCAVEEISFERAPFDGSDASYVNAAAPADFSCHVFHSNGGRVAEMKAPKGTNDGRDWAYIEARVLQIGADQTACGTVCNELVAILGGLNDVPCQKLNFRLTRSETIPVQDNGNNYEANKYTGTFNAGADIDGGASGYSSLCTEDSTGVNYYYHVLLPR